MQRLLIVATLGLYVLLAVGIGIVRGVSVPTQPPQPLRYLLPETACEAPCWQGINTDDTSHADTVEVVLTLPDVQQQSIIEWTFAQPTQRIRLERGRDIVINTVGVRLGDFIAVLGQPDQQVRGNAFDVVNNRSGRYVIWIYEDLQFLLISLLDDDAYRISPQTPIRQVRFPAGVFELPVASHDWAGYVHWDAYTAPFGDSLTLGRR